VTKVLLIVAALVCGVVGQASAAPLKAYGQLPSLEQVQISPDGGRVAFINTEANGDRSIAVVRLADQKALFVGHVGSTKVRDLRWADADNLLITTSATTSVDDHASGVLALRDEYFFVEDLNVVSGRILKLLENAPGIWNNTISSPDVCTDHGGSYAVVEAWHEHDHQNVEALVRVNLANNAPDIIADGSNDTIGWLVDPHCRAVAEVRYDDAKGLWRLFVNPGGHWLFSRSISAAIDRPHLLGFNRDGTAVLVRLESGELDAVALEDGAWRPDPGDDFQYLLHDVRTGLQVGGEAEAGGVARRTYFDQRTQAGWEAVLKAFPGELVTLESVSDDGQKLLVKVVGPRDGASFSLVDLASHQAIGLGDQYSGIAPADVADAKFVSYPAADGLGISAVLTLPGGRPAKGLPLIVFPHGGPQAHDALGFDWWAQAMASRGYAVLQPNFRGSDGDDQPFIEKGYGQWGRKMQTDLSDGVRYLAARGMIDPKRVCIVGASYGGYAALAGATLDPGVYRCAVAVAGISDLGRFRAWVRTDQERSSNDVTRYWDRFIGVRNADDPVVGAISPARHADKASVPILLIHGRDDTVVPYDQSRTMQDALARLGKPVTLVTLDHEDHWLSRSETRQQMLKATIDFLEANNPPN
jgi:dipeptidyl aminopeptidase/acylaminoacyl peptidase